MVMCSNDMKSFYDCILHPVASLCLQRMGVAEAGVVCAFRSIQLLEHHIPTAYGDLTSSFGGEQVLKQESKVKY